MQIWRLTSSDMAIYLGKTSYVCSCIIILFLLCATGMTKEKMSIHPDQIAEVSQCFLKTWLIDRDINSVFGFLSENPVMGACLGDPNESLKWRLTRGGVTAKLKPAFSRLASDSPPNARLEDLISGQETKLAYARIKHSNSELFDLYPVGPDLLNVVENAICSGKDKTEFFTKGIRDHSEIYLMLFHFKQGLKITILWCREKDNLRILSIDFPE
jgi:hypothetical protein